MATIGELVGGMLDNGYRRAADQTLKSIAATMSTPLITQRLGELNAEARRLAEAGEKLTPDNPVLRALIADMEPALKRAASSIDGSASQITGASSDLAANATRQLSVPGLDDRQLASIGIRWNVPDPVAVSALIDYADKPAWGSEITKYTGLTLDTLRNQAVRGMALGWGPGRVAEEIVRVAQTLPLAQAQMLTRTLYLESYRTAAAANQLANQDILLDQIRIGTLDTRICMCCLALHGTRLAVGEKISDHHAGRCTSIAVVTGRPRTVQTGEDWFNGLAEGEQLKIAGPGGYQALKSGKAQIRDFVQRYTDPVFGEMVREASLKSLGVRQA